MVVLVLYVPLIFIHPLSPYVVVLWIGGLVVINRLRPIWLLPLLAVIAIFYLVPNLGYVNRTYGVFKAFGNIANNIATRTATTVAGGGIKPTLGPNHFVEPIIVTLLCILGIIGIVVRIRQGRNYLSMLVLLGAPLIVVFAVSYGNEGINRVWLFAYPWLGCFISLILWPDPVFEEGLLREDWRLSKRLARGGGHSHTASRPEQKARLFGSKCTVASVLILTAMLSIVLSYSQNEIYQVAPADVAAASYFYQHAPAGIAFFIDGGFPTLIGARYGTFMVYSDGHYYNLELADHPEFGSC